MAAVGSKAAHPTPGGAYRLLHDRERPWGLSPGLEKRLKEQGELGFRACVVEQGDKEFGFVMELVRKQLPAGRGIARIMCVDNPDHAMVFEANLRNMEREAAHLPVDSWKEHEPKALRAKVMQRFEDFSKDFSNVCTVSHGVKKAVKGVFVLPLLHGSDHWELICSNGFKRWGKHDHFHGPLDGGAGKKSRDSGWFGDGLYFTNDLRYAYLYGKTVMVCFVSGRRPYPVVNDKPFPELGSDMRRLEGLGMVDSCNMHYAPVASTDPTDPEWMEYHACDDRQAPMCDEFVVGGKDQVLERFVVVVGVDFPKAPSVGAPPLAGLYHKLTVLLDDPRVSVDLPLYGLFMNKVGEISGNLNRQPSSQERELDHWLGKLFLADGGIDRDARQKLLLSQGVKIEIEEKKKLAAKPASKAKAKELPADLDAALLDVTARKRFPSHRIAAVEAREREKCERLLQAKANVRAVDSEGNSALHKFAEQGYCSLMSLLIESDRGLLKLVNNKNETALHAAVGGFNRKEACEFLIKAGADHSAKNKAGLTALGVAKQLDDHRLVKELTKLTDSDCVIM
ncbi:MAG TPA: ankyrin repeat domain-containing protein [Chlamydiales bacterium]|nr:ankyrin repeat domain-containing protein [Chlamydiales bacterium]